MKTKYRIMFLALLLGIGTVLLDAFINVTFFYKGCNYLDTLLYMAKPSDHYFRLIIVCFFLVFGFIISNLISKKEKADLLIKQGEENFFRIFNLSPEIILITRVSDSVVLKINKTFENIFGYKRTDLVGKTTLDFNIWKDLNKRKEFFEILMRDGSVSDFKAEAITKYGQSLFFQFYSMPINYDNEDCWITYGKDITTEEFAEEKLKKAYDELEEIVQTRTKELEQINLELDLTNDSINAENHERIKAEIALKESEEKYRSLLNQIPIGVYRTTIEGTFLQVNSALASILEYRDTDELLNSIVYDFYETEENRDIALDKLVSSTPVFQHEVQLVTKKGNKIWVRDRGRIVFGPDGEKMFIDGILENITERKEIEQALYSQSHINSTLADLSKSIIKTSELTNSSELILNSAMTLTNSRFGFIGLIDEEKNEVVFSAVENNCNFEFNANNLNLYKLTSEGLGNWIIKNNNSLILNFKENSLENNFLFDNSQRVNYFLSSPASVFGKIEGVIALAESDKEYSIQDLDIAEQLSALLAIAIQRNKADLEIKNALEKEHELSNLKSRLISMISHEYRTPLQAILMSTQLLADYNDHLSDDEKVKYFDRIRKSVSIMNNLLDDTISLNKFDIDNLERNIARVDIKSFCLDIVEELQIVAGNKCKIVSEFPEDEFMGYLDEKYLRDVLVNLLSNSVKYSFDQSEIIFKIELLDSDVVFTVEDKGIGISESEKESLFVPFFRGENVGNVQGTGLGLSIVKNTVDFLGGSLEFESEVNVGTKFKVKIPLILKRNEL